MDEEEFGIDISGATPVAVAPISTSTPTSVAAPVGAPAPVPAPAPAPVVTHPTTSSKPVPVTKTVVTAPSATVVSNQGVQEPLPVTSEPSPAPADTAAAPASSDKIASRVARFGVVESSAPASKVVKQQEATAPVDEKLAQRAARFGLPEKSTVQATAAKTKAPKAAQASTGTKPAKVELSEEEKERLLKRAERFGAISTVVKRVEAEKLTVEQQEKLVARAERFGLTSASNSVSGDDKQQQSGNKKNKRNK